MELTLQKKIVLFMAVVFIALCTVNLAEARERHGHSGKGYKHGGNHLVHRLTRYLSLDETQAANLTAVIELKKTQRHSSDLQEAHTAVQEAAYAEVFSNFNYTAAVKALSDIKAANASELAVTNAVFLESLSAEQRERLARIHRYLR